MEFNTMTTNQILISSDHHANWDALEKLFQIAEEKNIPFIINGDIIGDYHFEDLASNLELKFPHEIREDKLKESLGKEIFEKYMIYSEIVQNNGDMSSLLRQTPEHLREKSIEKIRGIVEYIESSAFKEKMKNVNINSEYNSIISNHKIQLRALYETIIKFHAKDLANLIDTYKVETYFLNGNHEPVYFPKMVNNYLENKNLFKDLGEENGIIDINGMRVCGVSNVCSLMPFLEDLYSKTELDRDFSHQRGENRPLLYGNVNNEHLLSSNAHTSDSDWVRIMKNKKENFDLFVTHGQIGIGAWRSDKNASEMPTLHVAAMLSSLSKLTVDGHLHSTHQMKNPLGRDTIRAVGNSAFLLTKEGEEIKKEKISVDAPYDNRGKYDFENVDLKKLISEKIVEKIDFEKLLL